MRRGTLLLVAMAGLPAAACKPIADDEAIQLVRAYNSRVIEAFRTGDAKLIEPVTGATDGKRLTGLIGVKSDMGITLDSRLVEFKPLRVTSVNGEAIVYTEERWSYRDRRIGTGEQVGDASEDHYFMRYHLKKEQGRWVVDEIAFDKEPEVGRKEMAPQVDVKVFHGNIQTVDPGAGPAGAPAPATPSAPPPPAGAPSAAPASGGRP